MLFFLLQGQLQSFTLRRRMPSKFKSRSCADGSRDAKGVRRKSEQPRTSQQPPSAPHLKQSREANPAAVALFSVGDRPSPLASWQRSHIKCDTNETSGPRPNYQTTNTRANIRPRCACRSFKLVGACLVLTFPGHPPCGKRILIGSSLDPWYRSSICEHARAPRARFRPIPS